MFNELEILGKDIFWVLLLFIELDYLYTPGTFLYKKALVEFRRKYCDVDLLVNLVITGLV